MKKRALALGLSLSMLIQPIWAPASFATDNPSGQVAAQNETKSYSHSISDGGLELIKSFEGFIAYPIWDYAQYSYGYGSYVDASTVYKDPKSPTGYSTTLYPDGIPEREAAELLRDMVDEYNVQLNLFLETYKIELNQNQFDALSSFTYNLGKYVWTKDTIIRDMLISGDYTEEEFTEELCDWCHAGGKFLQALYDRRLREAKVFFSEYSLSDPNADLYVVNADKLYIRSEPTTASPMLSYLTNSQVIRVHRYSDDGLWAFTSYGGFFGWVSKAYLIGVNESSSVIEVDSSGRDSQGIYYTFDNAAMTATVGSTAAANNTSGYDGRYAGEIILAESLLHNGNVYTVTSISDSAFSGCKKIDKIYIPACITSIGDNAFKDSSLTEIYYTKGSTAEGWAKNSAFKATDYRCRTGHKHGDWQVVQKASDSAPQIEERTCSVCGGNESRQYARIEIASFPRKIEYKVGDQLNTAGLALEVVYTDGTRVAAPDFKVVSYDTTTLGKQTVTVQYSTFTTSFDISVSEKVLTGITITEKPKKLTYVEGNKFVADGLAVSANYDNNSSIPVTEYSISGFDANKVGKQTITVTYNDFTATFEVTVKAKTLTAFTFVSYPNTLEYFCGEAFDPTGMVLKLTYNNGTVEHTDSGFKISGFNTNKAGEQTVKVSYGGVTQSLRVVVILNELRSEQYATANGVVAVTEDKLTVAQFTSALESGDRVQVLKDGKKLPADSTIGTGMTVRLVYNGEIQDSAELIVVGDLSGDGKCSVGDFVTVSDYFVGRTELSDAALSAADINRDGKVDLSDYVELYSIANSDLSAVPLSSTKN